VLIAIAEPEEESVGSPGRWPCQHKILERWW